MKKIAAALLVMIVLLVSASLSEGTLPANLSEGSRLIGLLITREDLSEYAGEAGAISASCTQNGPEGETEYHFGEVNGLRLICFIAPEDNGEGSSIISNADVGICLSYYHDITWKAFVPEEDSGKNTVGGNMKAYRKMADGTWMCDGYTYQYRLEIRGRMPNAAVDSCFVYLSNIDEIPFERAYMAAGLSSNLDDYFSPEEAVLVEMN